MKHWKQYFHQTTFFHQKVFHITFYKQLYAECFSQGNHLGFLAGKSQDDAAVRRIILCLCCVYLGYPAMSGELINFFSAMPLESPFSINPHHHFRWPQAQPVTRQGAGGVPCTYCPNDAAFMASIPEITHQFNEVMWQWSNDIHLPVLQFWVLLYQVYLALSAQAVVPEYLYLSLQFTIPARNKSHPCQH